ncbi:MAG TPA: SIR2 family protein [Prolixibacteraceae bacterium]|nr:SIR2 family protein [Prolixibacteraceae bacterium]
MEEDKKYIFLQNGYTIAFDTQDCFVNGEKRTKELEEKRSSKEIANALKKNSYDNFFRKHSKNLVVLTAAGTSLDNGIVPGMTRIELWKHSKSEIKELIKVLLPCSKKIKEIVKTKDIEAFLSHIMLYEKVNEDIRDIIIPLRKKLEEKIKEACSLLLDKLSAPHKTFLDKITARKPSDPRVQLFTTNYDTLFEQAANEGGFVIIDGFSFTHPREFSGRYFDYDIVHREKTRIKQEESFVPKVLHLYKLHGSLNWEKDTDGKITQKDNPNSPLIIYPASEKYESSYEQPYFEMMSRFQQALRKEDTLLIVIGFGFQDKHIQNVIIEAVAQNPSFQLVIVNYNVNEKLETTNLEVFFKNVESMEVKRKVTILFDKFSDFTNNYPENRTYIKQDNNEPIQS